MNVTEVLEKYLGDSEADKHAMDAERLIVAVTERILIEMRKQEVSKSDLARKLNRSKAFVSSTLDGSRNMTLRTLAHIASALGLKASLKLEQQQRDPPWASNIFFFDTSRQVESDEKYAESFGGSSVSMKVA